MNENYLIVKSKVRGVIHDDGSQSQVEMWNILLDSEEPLLQGKLIASCPTERLAQAIVNGLCWADDECGGFNEVYWLSKFGFDTEAKNKLIGNGSS